MDRSRRLALFGCIALLVGGVCLLLGGLNLVLWVAADRLPGLEHLPPNPAGYAMGLLLYLLLATAFGWTGYGSLRRRRWVRPMMLTLAWSWLLCGLLALAVLPFMLDAVFAASALPPEVAGPARVLMLAMVGAAGVALPALFVWAYRDPAVQQTCERYDPNPSWTDRCPVTVLGLSAGLGAAAVLLIVTAARPMVPWFGKLLGGWPAVAVLLVTAAASAYLAVATYRLRWSGWWGTLGLTLVLGVSAAWTFHRVDPADIYREMGYVDGQLEIMLPDGGAHRGVYTASTVVATLLGIAYLIPLRRHFAEGASHSKR